MSPDLHELFDDAADDTGWPSHLDVARLRVDGRRAVVRRRLVAAGSAIAATAVVGGVTFAAGVFGSSPFGGDNVTAAASDPTASASADTAWGCAFVESHGEPGGEGFLTAPMPSMSPGSTGFGTVTSEDGTSEAGSGSADVQGRDRVTVTKSGGAIAAKPRAGAIAPTLAPTGMPRSYTDPEISECTAIPLADPQLAPLTDALEAAGLHDVIATEAQSMDVDGGTSITVGIEVSDGDRIVGTASVGVYDSLDDTAMDGPDGPPVPWCGPSLGAGSAVEWEDCDLSAQSDDDPAVVTSGTGGGSEALGAVDVRADGSVIAVSLGGSAFSDMADPDDVVVTPPLDEATVRTVLAQIVAAYDGAE